MRHPNGYGTVAKLSGNRRNPYVVRKTRGWDDRGYPVYDVIGYYPTREAGMIALGAYNSNPYDVDKAKTTMEELYNKWLELKAPKLSASLLRCLKAAYNHCSALHGMKYKDIRAYHMQDAIDRCGRGASTQSHIKSLFRHLDNLGMELDVVGKSYASIVTSEPMPESSKMPFTEDEISQLWAIQDEPWVDSVLVFLYSGWRISELLGLKCSDIDLESGTMKGGVKTRAGKNRIVPIHSKIADIVKKRYNEGNVYLFSINGSQVPASTYYTLWKPIMERIGASHTVHETRHTLRSRLDSAGANKKCIDLIMGHSGGDVGERVYTHKTLQELKETIELITH